MAFQEWTSAGSYNFTVPHGVKEIIAYMRGAGAGSQSGAGGGGGAWIKKTFSCSPGDVFSFSVGAGGTSGNAGGDTNWNSGELIAGGAPSQTGGTPSGSGDDSGSGGNGGNGTTSCCDSEEPPNCSDCYGGGGSSGGASNTQNNGSDATCDTGSCTSGNGGAAPTNGARGGDGGSNSGIENGGGAGGSGGGLTANDGFVRIEWTPGHLAFTVQPTSAAADASIFPCIEVTARFSDNTTDTSFFGNITLSISTNPAGSTLSGTNPQSASAGISTHCGINLNNAGTNYTLDAAATDFDSATSDPFDIFANVDLPLSPLAVEVNLVATTISGAANLDLPPLGVATALVSPKLLTTNIYCTPSIVIPNPNVGPPVLRQRVKHQQQLQISTVTPAADNEPISPFTVEAELVAPILVTANTYWTPAVILPNPRVGPPALRQQWRQRPQLQFDPTVIIAAASLGVEADLVAPIIVAANTYWTPTVTLPNPRVGPPVLRRAWKQKPLLPLAVPDVPATDLALFPMQVVVQSVNSQPVYTAVSSGPHANSMKNWFNGFPVQGTNNSNKELKYWRNGLPSQPIMAGDPVTLPLNTMRVETNLVVPPQSAGAALPLSAMRVEVIDIPLSQVGGVNVVTFAMPVIVTVSEQPQSDATIALPAMQTEVRSNIQATTGGSGLQLPSLQALSRLGVNQPTGSPSLTVGLTTQVNLVNETPIAGTQVPMFPLEIEIQYAASVTGGANIPAFSMETISAVGIENILITPEVVLSLQEIGTEELPVTLEYDTNISLSLQEVEVPNLYKIDRLLGGQASSHFMEIERSAVSVMIFGSEPNQPFKFNPSATTFHRNGPSHTIHLSRVKPDFTTINATFELLTPFAELQPNEFFYQAPGGFLRVWNEDVIQASLIQDGDDPAIVISVTPVNQVFNPVAATSLAAARVTT